MNREPKPRGGNGFLIFIAFVLVVGGAVIAWLYSEGKLPGQKPADPPAVVQETVPPAP